MILETLPKRLAAVLAAAFLAALAVPRANAQDSAAVDTAGGSLFTIPFLFYQPETKIGAGVMLLHTYRTARDTRPSTNNFTVLYTQRRQFSVQYQAERWLPDNRWRLGGELAASRFPDKFYGIGNSTRDTAENVTLETRRALFDVRRALGRGRFAGLLAVWQRTETRDLDTAGLLQAGGIAGSRGADLMVIGATLTLDTRDNRFTSWRGAYAGVTVRRALDVLGGDLVYTRAELDLRTFRSIGRGHVVAGQVVATTIRGAAPFFDLASLGGANVLRGYYEGRFRDRERAVAQGEWRFPVRGRFSGVAFGAAGQVAQRWQEMSLRDAHVAGGLGVRFQLSPADRVNLRIDYAVGRRDSGLYFAFGEAF